MAATPQRTIALDSDLTIGSVHQLREQLADALKSGGDITLNGELVERVDTSALQLLLAFRQELASAHASFSWYSPSPQLLSSAQLLGVAALLGFT